MSRHYRLVAAELPDRLEFASVRIFRTYSAARVYRDTEFPDAEIWVFLGPDGYRIDDDEGWTDD